MHAPPEYGMGLDPKENDPILWFMDLSVVYPFDHLFRIRSFCSPGKRMYAPQIFRLMRGAPLVSDESFGFCETRGWGIAAMHSSDFFRSGFDSRRFGAKWGGEDVVLSGKAIFEVHST